jgi:hypothetical protein
MRFVPMHSGVPKSPKFHSSRCFSCNARKSLSTLVENKCLWHATGKKKRPKQFYFSFWYSALPSFRMEMSGSVRRSASLRTGCGSQFS